MPITRIKPSLMNASRAFFLRAWMSGRSALASDIRSAFQTAVTAAAHIVRHAGASPVADSDLKFYPT